MTEPGGPNSQGGIFYQNTVAARYLADMLILQPLLPRETVVDVRVEAPAHVDDIVVSYADGHREWIQAKSNLKSSTEPWKRLWNSFAAQIMDPEVSANDWLVLALGTRGPLSERLQDMAERASTSVDAKEWEQRLSKEGKTLLLSVKKALRSRGKAFDLFRRMRVQPSTLNEIEDYFKRLDLGSASPVPKSLLSNLRDMAGGESRVRGAFRAAPLRRRLASEFSHDLFEPIEWGMAAYRNAIGKTTNVDIPGRGIAVPVKDLVVWPRTRRREVVPERGFEDELPRWDPKVLPSDIDLSRFPNEELFRCILVAGPGFGKSMLISAFTDRLLQTPITPAEISLQTFGAVDQTIMEFLQNQTNRDFTVRVDWQRLADQGLCCLLFDGLDEVPSALRSGILKRIAQFSGRFPSVPWLLTVRDPAVLGGPLDGDIVELEPFDNPEIFELVDKFKPFTAGLDGWKFTSALQAYPDIARLARIPLFLSIMLASWSPTAPLPSKRSDLIERYLALLLSPEKLKAAPEPHLSSLELRQVAQVIAFESLEREEIGLSQRQARDSIDRHRQGAAETSLMQLLATGILRQRPDGRLQFPYTIVQEYLAAVHLVETVPDSISTRIGEVAKRPWAQVLQFALELLPDSSPQISSMLEVTDDVFSTNLRLVGRCIANGAAVNQQVRDEVGARLAELWGESSHSIRERVGRLIVDAYSRPLHTEVRRRLGWHWLLAAGAGEIVTSASDPTLTKFVLDELLAGHLSMFMNLRELKEPLKAIANDVVSRVIIRAKTPRTGKDDFEGLASILDLVRVDDQGAAPLNEIISDPAMPLTLRFSAQGALPTTPPPLMLAEAKQALASSNWQDQSAAMRVFARSCDVAQSVIDVLADGTLPDSAKDYMLERLDMLTKPAMPRDKLSRTILARCDLKSRHTDILKVYLVRAGDRATLFELLGRFETAPIEIVKATLISLNSFPDKAIGEKAIERLRQRPLNSSDVSGLISSAVTGLTYTITGDGWNHYGMVDAPPHPSLELWAPVFDMWLGTEGLSKVDRLDALSSMLKIRPDALAELRKMLFSVEDPDSAEWDGDEYGHVLRQAMDDLRRRQVRIPAELAERFAISKRANLIYAGVNAIAAEATSDSLIRLRSLYGRVPSDEKSTVLEAIEVVASRLNIRIMPENLH